MTITLTLTLTLTLTPNPGRLPRPEHTRGRARLGAQLRRGEPMGQGGGDAARGADGRRVIASERAKTCTSKRHEQSTQAMPT